MELLIINRGYLPSQMPSDSGYQNSIMGGFSPNGLWNHMGRGAQGQGQPQSSHADGQGLSSRFSDQGLWSHMGRGQREMSCPVMNPFVPNGRSGGLWNMISTMPSMTNFSNIDAATPMDKVPLDQPNSML